MGQQDKQVGIQFARAIAAFSIVYVHSWVSIARFPEGTSLPIPWLSTHGWLGVNFFFAISGYVIALVVSREPFDVRAFLVRRIFRLYPLWLLTLTAFAVCARVWRGFQPQETVGFFFYSATLLPTNGFPFYDIGWSLQHEMVFYLLAAAIIPFFGIWGLIAFLSISAVAVRSFDLPWYIETFANHHAEFLAGVLAFLARDRLSKIGFFFPAALGAALTVSFFATSLNTLLPISLFFLVVAFANIRGTAENLWTRIGERLGDASYSIYLIHPLVFLVASAAVGKFPTLSPATQEPIRFACILVVIAVSLVSWFIFERPIIRLGNVIAKSRRR